MTTTATVEGALLALEFRRFLPVRLAAVSNRLTRRAAQLYADRFQLSAPEWRVIAVLGQRDAISPSAVIAETAMDKVRVSRAVAKLLKRGFISRETYPRDRRHAILKLTASGRETYAQIVPLIQNVEAEMMAKLSQADRETLSNALGKIEDYLKRTGSDLGGQPDVSPVP